MSALYDALSFWKYAHCYRSLFIAVMIASLQYISIAVCELPNELYMYIDFPYMQTLSVLAAYFSLDCSCWDWFSHDNDLICYNCFLFLQKFWGSGGWRTGRFQQTHRCFLSFRGHWPCFVQWRWWSIWGWWGELWGGWYLNLSFETA